MVLGFILGFFIGGFCGVGALALMLARAEDEREDGEDNDGHSN